MTATTALIEKYNVPAPRYTSYPTVPYWDEHAFEPMLWSHSFRETFFDTNEREGISLYLHLPFCEKLCTFCGCNKRITRNHSVEDVYIEAVLKEWSLYLALMGGETPSIREVHLGGGSPTFFSPDNLSRLLGSLFERANIRPDASLSFEGNPQNTTREHLQALYNLQFRRVSFGIQDFDPVVQQVINRVQPFEQVQQVTEWAREIGYTSVNYDIVFGLPMQRLESICQTIEQVNYLRPDRIAYYSYAHVPWVKGVGQRKFTEEDLPAPALKRQFYEAGRQLLEQNGYLEIGMDHFALPTDTLAIAMQEGHLHRNFMGYTDQHTSLSIGLGVSSISDSWGCFAQNEKTLEDYYRRLEADELPVFRGHLLTRQDRSVRRHILNLICRMETCWQAGTFSPEFERQIANRLVEAIEDGLCSLNGRQVLIHEAGRPFVRNICMAFDERLWLNQPSGRIFSMSV